MVIKLKVRGLGGIRVKFLFAFLVSVILSIVFVLVINDVWRNKQMDYSYQINQFKFECNGIYHEIMESSNNEEKIREIINRDTNQDEVFIIDTKGSVILRHNNRFEKQFYINKILEEQGRINFNNTKIKKYNIEYFNINRLYKIVWERSKEIVDSVTVWCEYIGQLIQIALVNIDTNNV